MLNIYSKGNCHGAFSRKVLLSDLHVGPLERVHILRVTLKLRRECVYIRVYSTPVSTDASMKCEQWTLVGFMER